MIERRIIDSSVRNVRRDALRIRSRDSSLARDLNDDAAVVTVVERHATRFSAGGSHRESTLLLRFSTCHAQHPVPVASVVLALAAERFSPDDADQQLERSKGDVDERSEDDGQDENDVEEVTLIPGQILALAARVRSAVAPSDVFRPPNRRIQRRGGPVAVGLRQLLRVLEIAESRRGVSGVRGEGGGVRENFRN